MKKATEYAALILAALLLVLCSGCGIVPEQTGSSAPSSRTSAMNYSLTYSYYIRGNGYVSEKTWGLLDAFGKNENIIPAAPVTEMHSEIPEFENNAKGTDPLHILMPDLELHKYKVCNWTDTETGLSVSGYYRLVGDRLEGMATDELVKVYMDPSQSIVQYETVNLGKYDNLGLDEVRFTNLRNTFYRAIQKAVGETAWQYSAAASSPTTYRVFTDSQDRIVIATTVTLEQDHQSVETDLFAVVNATVLYDE